MKLSAPVRSPRLIAPAALIMLVACESETPAPPAQAPVSVRTLSPSDVAGADATSTLSDDKTTFAAGHAVDGDRNTAWCEGAEGLGEGEAITVRFKQPEDLTEIRIDGGFFKDDRTLTNNGRPRKVRVDSDTGWSHILSLPKVPLREHRAKEIKTKAGVLTSPGTASSVTVTLLQADDGRFTQDVCISEIAFVAR